MDKLTSMKVFCRVVARENFSQAARDLRISPAMVTKHVAALEEQLGIRLLNRTTRRVNTTEAGERYYHLCTGLLNDIEEAEASLNELGTKPSGLLRLTAPIDFGVLCLAPAIAAFLSRYPEVEIDINYQDRKVNLIEEGFDLALRIGALSDSTLVAQRLLNGRLICCASPAYLQQHGRPQTPQDLRDHNCLTYTYSSTNNEWLFYRDKERHAVKVSGRLNSNNGRAMVAAARQGVGIILKPNFMVEDALARGELVELFADYEIPTHNVYLVYPHRQFLPAKMRLFIEFLKEYFSEKSSA
ncbi:LysR family transcriptional regulator [Motiliproteus sp. SC1-56]|uniref:LysR family transcriptional regulator n=1 Tax=Motiliproteus sp. SC1-56 TaxID=2799565 RepID=UPI001A8E53E2|nr:LysR family transcriptional regulator [Motiliproteus sp. SC1-56]